MKRNWSILALLALLILPVLACQTLLGGANPAPPAIPELPTVQVPDIQVTVPGVDVTVPPVPTITVGGQAPADIPMVDQKDNLVTTEQSVSYDTTMASQDVVNFYKDQMPAQGWTEAEGGISFGGTTVINYTKDNRTAVVTITEANGKVTVVVLIAAN